MARRIQHRRGTSAQWSAANPVLATGEIGYDITLGRLKIGDGVTAWSALAWAADPAGSAADLVDALQGHVVVFGADGPVETSLGDGWVDGATASTAFDDLNVLNGRIVIPNPDTGAVGGTNPAAHGVAYRDFADLGTWAGTRVSVSGYWTGERPYEASPLLHVVPSADDYGLGAWPVDDILGQPALLCGYVGKNNTKLRIESLIAFSSLPEALGDLATERRYHIEVRSWDGEWTVWIDGILVAGPFTVPAALAGSTKHGFAIDNNQTDGNGGAGGARPANRGAFEGPFVVSRLLSREESVAPHRSIAPALAAKADRNAVVQSIVAGTNITVDDTDPQHPVISSSGGGAVSSVNGETGAVTLTASDIGSTPTGTTAATNVQAAIAELSTEKADVAGETFTGAVVVNDGSGGSTTITHSSGTPAVQLRANAADAQHAVGLGILLGFPGIGLGAGGASAPDTFFVRSAAGQLSTGTAKLTVADAAAATDAVNRQSGDARWTQRSSNLSDLASVATARTNLGLGPIALRTTIQAGDYAAGSIVNADVSASAAIAATKIAYAGGTGMSATNVETAIDELADEKADVAGDTFTGTVVVNDGSGGSTTIGHSSGTPVVQLRSNAADTHHAVGLGILLGLPGIGLGAGGSSAPDTFLVRSAAGQLSTGTAKLTVADATAATDALNRQTGDGRYLRPGLASIVNADISASAAIALSKLATDPLARANHTGTQAGSTVDAATDAARGTVELATTAEVQTGTDTSRAVTPAGVAALQKVVFPRKAGSYYTQGGQPTANLAWTQSTMYLIPWGTATAGTVDRLAFHLAGLGNTGQVARMGLYAIDSNGEPTGSPLLDAGTAVTDSGTGIKEFTVSLAITPGWYAVAIVPQGNTGGFVFANSASSVLAGLIGMSTMITPACWLQTGVTGALPTISLTGTLDGSAPRVGVRLA